MIQLTDDGTLDTVLKCSECDKEFRMNYANTYEGSIATDDEDNIPTYDEFVDEMIAETAESHDCNDEENDFLWHTS